MSSISQSGVYTIRNVFDGKRYIGSARRLHVRRAQHFSDLRCDRHSSTHLQRAYDKYGVDGFLFEVVELCPVDLLIEREQYWIDYYRAFDSACGYNMRARADSSLGHRHSDEVRQRMRDGFNRNRQPMNLDSRARGDATRRGQKRNEEMRRRMVEGRQCNRSLCLPLNVIATARMLFSDGWTKTAIAEHLGINRRTVWKYINVVSPNED